MPALSPDQWQALSPYLDESPAMTDEERSTWLSTLRTASPGLAEQLEMLFRDDSADHQAVEPRLYCRSRHGSVQDGGARLAVNAEAMHARERATMPWFKVVLALRRHFSAMTSSPDRVTSL